MSDYIITKPKTPKEQLTFPQLHWITSMDWIPKLGDQAFCGWLQLITMADRSNKEREEDIIPQDLASLAKKLGTSKTTLYKNVIKPLWNYALIDLKEYSQSKRKTTKPINVIVYLHPQNDIKLMTEPLQKVRDYEKDYHSEAKTYAKKRTKKALEPTAIGTVQNLNGTKNEQEKIDSSTVQNLNGIKKAILVGDTVQNLNGRPFKIWTVDRLKFGRNNYKTLNLYIKSLNSFSNLEEEEEEASGHSPELTKICKTIKTHNLEDQFIDEFLKAVEKLGITSFTHEQLEKALNLVEKDKGVKHYPSWTAGKLQRVIRGFSSTSPIDMSKTKGKRQNGDSGGVKNQNKPHRVDKVPEWISNPNEEPNKDLSDQERQEKKDRLKNMLSKYKKEEVEV